MCFRVTSWRWARTRATSRSGTRLQGRSSRCWRDTRPESVSDCSGSGSRPGSRASLIHGSSQPRVGLSLSKALSSNCSRHAGCCLAWWTPYSLCECVCLGECEAIIVQRVVRNHWLEMRYTSAVHLPSLISSWEWRPPLVCFMSHRDLYKSQVFLLYACWLLETCNCVCELHHCAFICVCACVFLTGIHTHIHK